MALKKIHRPLKGRFLTEEKIINSILAKIDNKRDIQDGYISFSDKRYKPINLDKNNFNKISKINSAKKIAFIDGGNAETLKLTNLSLQLVRIYYNIFDKNKKIGSERFDFYVLVEAVDKDGEIKYGVEMSEIKKISEHAQKSSIFDVAPNNFLDKLSFDSFDETIREGLHRIKISRIGEIVRRFLELNLANVVVNKLDNGDVIVLDGSLEAFATNENKFFDELYKKALEKNIIITGLCKTCTLLTNKGDSVVSVLRAISPEGSWYYYPVVDIDSGEHQANMFFVKLNENSKYIFRFEVFKNNKYEINELLSLLIDNSKDPVFLGYPYGLIDADKFARISNNEKEYLKTSLMIKLKREDLGKEEDAHTILDSIS